MNPIYATVPINVAGRSYNCGDMITCGAGARSSLLRFRQATEAGPEKRPSPDRPSSGGTPLAELLLESDHESKLISHGLPTIEQLQEYLDHGNKLRSLSGIGVATEKRILQSLQEYNEADI